MKNILVTGAAGFIGANFVEYFVNKHPDYKVVVVDKLTYAGNMANLDKVKDKISFEKADICDFEKMKEIFDKYDINGVIHFYSFFIFSLFIIILTTLKKLIYFISYFLF